MIFTPEERRALLAIAALLIVGQGLSFWERYQKAKPDRELSVWLHRIEQVRREGGGPDSLRMEQTPGDGGGADGAGIAQARRGGGGDSLWIGPVSAGASVRRPRRGPEEEPTAEPASAVPPGILETGRLRINEANLRDLQSLPGIGPALAGRIVEARAGGPFLRPADLLRVPGIGPKKLAALTDLLDFRTAPAGGAAPGDSTFSR